MLETFMKLSLWLFIPQFVVQGVYLEKSCPDYTSYYCACSLLDIAELKQIKMCPYQDLGMVRCHPCPERLQENVNCSSCPNDICPICSQHKFGTGNSYDSYIKQQVFLKFVPHHGIFYTQSQTYPSFDEKQTEEYHILTNINDINNQTLLNNNFFSKLEETHEGHSLANVQRNVNMLENINENSSNIRGKRQRNKNMLQKTENSETNLKSFQSPDDESSNENSLRILGKTKTDKQLEEPVVKIFAPEFPLPKERKDLTNLNDSNFYELYNGKSKNNNIRKHIGKYGERKPLHYLIYDKIRFMPFERFINNEKENLDENLENDLSISPHISGNEFKLKASNGDKCYFKRDPNASSTENSSMIQVFDFQCSVTDPSSNASFRKYFRDVFVIEEEIQKCASDHSINAFNVPKKFNLIKSSCNVSLPLMILLKSIKLAIGSQNKSHNMVFEKTVEVHNNSLINKIEFTMGISNVSMEQSTYSDKLTVHNKKSYNSINGKIKFEIKIHLKSPDKISSNKTRGKGNIYSVLPLERDISEDISLSEIFNTGNFKLGFSKDEPKVTIDFKNLEGHKIMLNTNDFLKYLIDSPIKILPENNAFNGQSNRVKYSKIPLTRERNGIKSIRVFPELTNQNLFDNAINESEALSNQIKEIGDLIQYFENEKKINSKFYDLIEEINNILKFSYNVNDWFKSSTHEIDKNNDLKLSEDGTESDDFAKRLPEVTYFSNDKLKNNFLFKEWPEEIHAMNEPNFFENSVWNENYIGDPHTDSKQSFSETEIQNNNWIDDLLKVMYGNSKRNFSDYETGNNDRFENEMEQEYNKSSFSDKEKKDNKRLEYWNYKKSERNIFDNVTENTDWLKNSEEGIHNKQKYMERENENSFKNSMDEIKQPVHRLKEKLVFSQINLPDIAKVIDSPDTKLSNTTNFTLKRMYRDIPRFSRRPKDSKISDKVVITRKSILKLYTLDPGRGKENVSDAFWFRYGTYIIIPQMNERLQLKKLKNSEIFKMLNVSISSLKKSKMYVSNCETCSVIYKLMLDSGFKNDLKLAENDNSSVIVFMDKPQFVLHHQKSKLPANNQRKFKKLTNNNNSFIIQINIDLLFLSSDDYKKLIQRNASETNFLSNTPWRDLRKKYAFSIPESYFSQSKIVNLSRSQKYKDLKLLFEELMNMDQLTEELQMIVFALLSKMHEHETTAGMKKINGASMILPTFNSKMTKYKIKTGSSVGRRKHKEAEKYETFLSSGEFGKRIGLKSDAADYKENGFPSNLKKIKQEPYVFVEKENSKSGASSFEHMIQRKNPRDMIKIEHFGNTSHSAKTKHSDKSENGNIWKTKMKERELFLQHVNKEPKIYKFVEKLPMSDYVLNNSSKIENEIYGLKENVNPFEKVNDQEEAATSFHKQVVRQNKEVAINDDFANTFPPENAPNDKFKRLKNDPVHTHASKTEKTNDWNQIDEKEPKITLVQKAGWLKQLDNTTVQDNVRKIEKEGNANNSETTDQKTPHLEEKNLKINGLEKKLFSENTPAENAGKFEIKTNHPPEILNSENKKLAAIPREERFPGQYYETMTKTNKLSGFKNDLKATESQFGNGFRTFGEEIRNSSNEISRVLRSLHNSEPVIHFRLTDKAILHRKKRAAAAIPHNHWCTIMSMRRNGNLDCTIWTFKKKCKLECHPGYSYGGSQTVDMNCQRRGNVWKADINKPCSGSGQKPERPPPPDKATRLTMPTLTYPQVFPTRRPITTVDYDDNEDEDYYDEDEYED